MKANNEKTVEKLNQVLSDLQVVYQNLRTMHWLVKGEQFFMLHKLYEEFYTETAETVDEVAERILMLGGTPLHQFADYLKNARVEPVVEVPKGKESLKLAVNNYNQLLSSYRELNAYAAENGDEGTAALFSELIGSTEKKLWMLNSTLA
jgi:starvation-inducible DNA-binding protein